MRKDEHGFCRAHLTAVRADVINQKAQTSLRNAWVHDAGNQWEFHGPNRFYYHGIRACCAWEAKALGWQRWLDVIWNRWQQGTDPVAGQVQDPKRGPHR